ncbi:hypothetical protein SKAU_G00231460 [Synaphobranchus kaupii]|uniref:Uncharacterized protein n=1 Tax=Synaphobranchus kaupii TaxID=118154 RepID=A0A9Q1ISE2_SYNKA|nr:hypothetical protein SKAU_G00231460 [Synaphobranchus kaupii]
MARVWGVWLGPRPASRRLLPVDGASFVVQPGLQGTLFTEVERFKGEGQEWQESGEAEGWDLPKGQGQWWGRVPRKGRVACYVLE